jgi:recombination protein RecT
MTTATTTLPSKRQQVDTVRDYLLANRKQIELALPKHLGAERFLRTAFTSFSQQPMLYDCSTRSLLGALVQCAQLGLEPGVLGQVYLVPFRNRRKNTIEVTVVPGYKGLLELARRSGQISTITATCVYEGDHYVRTLGTDPRIEHRPAEVPVASKGPDGQWVRRPLVAVYAVARLKDGAVQFESLTRADCEYHRDRFSKAAGDGPWSTDFEAMCLKTVLRRLAKLLPAAVELHTAVALDEHAEAGVSQDLGALVSGPPEPATVPTQAVAGALSALTESLRTPRPEPAPPEDEPIEEEDDEAPEEAPEEPVGAAPAHVSESMEPIIKRSIVLQQRNRLNLPEEVWQRHLREFAGVEKIEDATLDGLDQLELALKKLQPVAGGRRR